MKNFTKGDIQKFLNACWYGKLYVVKSYIKRGFDVTIQNDEGLKLASANGNDEVIELLVNAGANVEADNHYPTRIACVNGHLKAVQVLENLGGNVRAQNNYAFVWACYFGHVSMVEYLIKRQVDVTDNNNRALSLVSCRLKSDRLEAERRVQYETIKNMIEAAV